MTLPLISYIVASALLGGCHAATNVQLDEDGDYSLRWKFDETNITFSVTARTSGWFSFGFSPNGGMKNSDMVLITRGSGMIVIEDAHTKTEDGLPRRDISQDWTLINSSYGNGLLNVILSRPIVLCDADEDMTIHEHTMKVIWAAGPSPDVEYHEGLRGSKSVYLLVKQDHELPPRPDSAYDLSFTMDNYAIQPQETTYLCSLMEIPEIKGKQHVISFKTIISPETHKYVHHILLYACFHKFDGASLIHPNNHTHECGRKAKLMPEDMQKCSHILFVWAVGGVDFHFPDHVGYAMGTDVFDSPSYFVLEVHYNNPQLHRGLIDNSGMKITVSPEVRFNDANIAYIGVAQGFVVPPNHKITLPFWCSDECTRETIPPAGVNSFATLLHAHNRARRLSLRQFRGEEDVGTLTKDDLYDGNYQEYRHLEKEVKIMPGDTLKVTCEMDSTKYNSLAVGAADSDEEMCLAFIWYYPKCNFAQCGSFPKMFFKPNHSSVYKDLGLPANRSYSGDLRANVQGVSWTREAVSTVEKAMYDEPAYSKCFTTSSVDLKAAGKEVSYPASSRSQLAPDFGIACALKDELQDRGGGSSGLTATLLPFMIAVTVICML